LYRSVCLTQLTIKGVFALSLVIKTLYKYLLIQIKFTVFIILLGYLIPDFLSIIENLIILLKGVEFHFPFCPVKKQAFLILPLLFSEYLNFMSICLSFCLIIYYHQFNKWYSLFSFKGVVINEANKQEQLISTRDSYDLKYKTFGGGGDVKAEKFSTERKSLRSMNEQGGHHDIEIDLNHHFKMMKHLDYSDSKIKEKNYKTSLSEEDHSNQKIYDDLSTPQKYSPYPLNKKNMEVVKTKLFQ